MEAILDPSIPSARLEQEAQIFGFLDKAFPGSLIGSPQQIQMLGFTRKSVYLEEPALQAKDEPKEIPVSGH
jgi:hypothetical protein